MLGYETEQRSLTKEQKRAVSLLSVGTFLEYFDLMLYVHMSVLLNELFFPETDPYTASLISAAVFCSTFVFRPIGALIFGYIGDKHGRKATVVITTMMMAMSCRRNGIDADLCRKGDYSYYCGDNLPYRARTFFYGRSNRYRNLLN